MRRLCITVLAGIVLCCAAWAEDAWQPLAGAEIADALTDRGLSYARASQHFYASGRTSYDNGREGWGYWRVDGDAYCSQWPPADGWACFRMERHSANGSLKFIGDSGAETVGRYTE